jgi:hypothetical protein
MSFDAVSHGGASTSDSSQGWASGSQPFHERFGRFEIIHQSFR